ncbi:hypothetical protein F511_32351 [Dorcoceras hygrometricum]|uniref:Uncharacterized protein n=1 Tax=Dorcoceras hygrometricum TaxID=472368 RepID=A0A2Z7ARR1_9LAMI|nr:hypothetical protein F511_32351 [Dorcoceras hygrometricum]
MGSELIRTEAGFEDLNTSVDRHLAYFRPRYFLSSSSSKPSIVTVHQTLFLRFTVDFCRSLEQGARRNFSVRECLRQLTREFFSSFELLVLFVLRFDLVFLFLLSCLGTVLPIAGATGNLAGQSGASASRSPFG